MINVISKSLIPILKWGTVIIATAVVVISIQVAADGARVTEVAAIQVPEPAADSKHQWTPSAGFADLIEQVSPAVVHVVISGVVRSRSRVPQFDFPPGSPFEDFFDQFRDRNQPEEREERRRPLGIGSGFIISEDGYVVTNNHVIKDADEITVTMTNGDEYEAELQGTDVKTDLALLKLKDAKDLPYVAWGDDEQSRVGDWVVAIGNPFGLGGSASTGIISARGRDIRSGPYDDYIQVDAAINRGNSGGPLFNLRGEVIGINTAIYSPNGGSVGIGFSIPASLAKNVITQLQEKGEVERAWIGVEIQPLTDELAEGFGRDNDYGALVSKVTPDAPAEKAGIKIGDIILSFNGSDVKAMRDLPRVVAQSTVGKKSSIVVWRDGEEKTLNIKTERFPDDEELARMRGFGNGGQVEEDDDLGATLSNLTDAYRERFGIADDVDGVLVLDVARDSLAAQNGLRSGDILTSVNNVRVSSPEQVTELIDIARQDGRSKIVVLLQRNNNSRFIPFSLERE